METEVPLHEYFNRLEPLQTSVSQVMAARDLVHHHVGNGAQVLMSWMARDQKPKDAVEAFTIKAQEINKKARESVRAAVSSIIDEATRLEVHNTNLVTLVALKTPRPRETFEAMAELQRKIDADMPSIAQNLRTIRREAEEEMLRASGYAAADFRLTV